MLSGEFHTTYASDMALFETRRARRALAVFIVALFAIPFLGTSYWLDVANRAAIAVIAATGLNILTGYTGQISLGNAAFLAVGGYATAFLANHGVPFLVACPASGIVAALAGMVFGIPSLRLKGLYLAMAALAAHFIVEFTASHWEAVTGGVAGVSVPAPNVFGARFADDRRLFFLTVPICIGLLYFARNLFRTRVGKAFIAIRDQDISAEVMGVAFTCLYARSGTDLKTALRSGGDVESLLRAAWTARRDRGAEDRLALQDRRVPMAMNGDPHFEMHTRGG